VPSEESVLNETLEIRVEQDVSRKNRVSPTPEEESSLIREGCRLFLENPGLTARQLFIKSQDRVISKDRQRLPKNKPVYQEFFQQVQANLGLGDQERDRVPTGAPGPAGGEGDPGQDRVTTGAPGAFVVIPGEVSGGTSGGPSQEDWVDLMAQVLGHLGDQHTIETTSLQLIHREVVELRRSVHDLSRVVSGGQVFRSALPAPDKVGGLERDYRDLTQKFQNLNETVSRVVTGLNDLSNSLQAVTTQQQQIQKSVSGFESLLTRIIGDLNGYHQTDSVESGLVEGEEGKGEHDDPFASDKDDSLSGSRLRITLMGVAPPQIPKVKQQVNGNARLRFVEMGKRFDDQLILNSDWIILTRNIPHHDLYRVYNLNKTKDRLIQMETQGTDVLVRTIQRLINQSQVSK
jgi:hypothetical protein